MSAPGEPSLPGWAPPQPPSESPLPGWAPAASPQPVPGRPILPGWAPDDRASALAQPPAPAQPPKPTGWRGEAKKIGIAVGITAVLGVGWWWAETTGPAGARAGDCMNGGTDVNRMEIVDCDAADADWTVVGRIHGRSEAETLTEETTVCAEWPEANYVVWRGKHGEDGDVLCLQPKG